MKDNNQKTTYHWIKRPLWATLLTMAALLISSITGGVLAALILGDLDQNWKYVIGASSITIIALGIVYLLRKLGNQSWSGLRMQVKWTTLLEFITGFVLAFVTIFISDMVSVMVGSAEWTSLNSELTTTTFVISVIGITLSQAFPEDLLFRGHLFDTLSHQVRPGMEVLITSVAFGSLHILSSGGAAGLGEQAMFAVYAISFGFVLAICRLVRGSLWLPVGFHAGNDQFLDMFITLENTPYIVHFIIVTIFMVLTGYVLLKSKHLISK